MLDPIRVCRFENINVPCKNDRVGYVEMRYGAGWRVPPTHEMKDKAQCTNKAAFDDSTVFDI